MRPTRRARARAQRHRPPPVRSAAPDPLYYPIAKPNQSSRGRGRREWDVETNLDGRTAGPRGGRGGGRWRGDAARVLPSASARQCCLYCAWPGGRRQHGCKALLGQVAVQQVKKSHGPSSKPKNPNHARSHGYLRPFLRLAISKEKKTSTA